MSGYGFRKEHLASVHAEEYSNTMPSLRPCKTVSGGNAMGLAPTTVHPCRLFSSQSTSVSCGALTFKDVWVDFGLRHFR